ncbi:type II toxin-antitoxin system Phd/YefM family antitoxin [Trinickia symbiotica]|nr:type II toxin-antitoxin system Phd/YefM family antitoxin [Trinickia symbiotica]
MTRLVMQCALHAESIDDVVESDNAHEGEEVREQLMSLTVDAMAAMAGEARFSRVPSEGVLVEFAQVVATLHDRMSRVRSEWGRSLLRDSAELLFSAATSRSHAQTTTLNGFRLKVLDGSRMSAGMKCSPGPGGCVHENEPAEAGHGSMVADLRALPVYDPDLAMIVDLVPYERGQINEREFVGALMESVRPGELWILDGQFSVEATLSSWPRRGSAFIVSEHGCAPVYRALDDLQQKGLLDGGHVYEQSVALADEWDAMSVFRRIEWHRAGSDDGAGKVVSVLTNAPASQLDAVRIVQLASCRWREMLPLPVDPVRDFTPLLAEVPQRASLLAGAIVAMAYNVLSVTLRIVDDALALDERDLERLPSHIAAGVRSTYAGMMIALPPESWRRYDQLPATELDELLHRLAVHVDPRSERRKRRENKLSSKSQASMRAATVDSLLREEDETVSAHAFRLRTIAMATRDFSSNPSKALRHASDALVMVTRYNRPIALLISVEDWNRLLGEVREMSFTKLEFDYAGLTQMASVVALREPSLN